MMSCKTRLAAKIPTRVQMQRSGRISTSAKLEPWFAIYMVVLGKLPDYIFVIKISRLGQVY
jgi:hypothetical protein